ncbi:MAG: HAD-IA family hydrolase [Elusimicrobia bacterium]|nr:HAD-IA family hydrolase [Elusimicrobiota bacterium]
MRAILLDFGGTLDADGTTWIDRFFSLYKDEGLVSRGREEFDRAFYASDDNLAKRFKLSGLDLEQTLALQAHCVLETLAPDLARKAPLPAPAAALSAELRGRRLTAPGVSGAGVPPPETIGSGPATGRTTPAEKGPGERVVARFLDDCRRHFRRNRPVLERLRRSFRLGIVSNFYGNLDSVLDGEGLLELFDTISDSGVVGAEKPDPAIFLHAARNLGLKAADCLMVGDSVRRDMRGAEGLGMPHALITADPAAACCPECWALPDLTHLEARLDRD